MTDLTTTAAATNKPDLLDCDPLMLSSYLLHHRFNGDAMATANFLLDATSTLPNAESLSARLLGSTTTNEEDEKINGVATAVSADATIAFADFGCALAPECSVSMTQPRGKFTMTVHENGIHFVNSKNQVVSILPDSVEYLVMFPKPEDCRATTSKPSGGDMVLLTTFAKNDSVVSFNDKALPQVCFQMAKEPPSHDETTWLDLLWTSLSLEKHQVAIVANPKFNSTRTRNGVYSFKSHDEGTTSSTTAGMPYVQCYHGVKDGVLFPMEQGLLFFKYVVSNIVFCSHGISSLSLSHSLTHTHSLPHNVYRPPMFLHRSTLHSIACGRGSGASSRYVDLSVVLDNETRMELFTNIHRDEMVHLNDYIHTILIPAMKRDAQPEQEQQQQQRQVNAQQGETDDAATSLGKRKRVQRKASQEARQATRAHMERTQEEQEDSEDKDDDGWEEKDDDDDDESDDEEEEMAVDDNDDNDDSQEEFFEEQQASGSATESDDDD
jgi:hypothetical protein